MARGKAAAKYAKAILDLRKERNLTQEELARELGVSWVTICRWENGHTLPSKMARFLLERYVEKSGL